MTYGSTIMPGICVNKDVTDSCLTKDKDNRDMNVWLRGRLVIGGEAKCIDTPSLDLLEKELTAKTTSISV